MRLTCLLPRAVALRQWASRVSSVSRQFDPDDGTSLSNNKNKQPTSFGYRRVFLAKQIACMSNAGAATLLLAFALLLCTETQSQTHPRGVLGRWSRITSEQFPDCDLDWTIKQDSTKFELPNCGQGQTVGPTVILASESKGDGVKTVPLPLRSISPALSRMRCVSGVSRRDHRARRATARRSRSFTATTIGA